MFWLSSEHLFVLYYMGYTHFASAKYIEFIVRWTYRQAIYLRCDIFRFAEWVALRVRRAWPLRWYVVLTSRKQTTAGTTHHRARSPSLFHPRWNRDVKLRTTETSFRTSHFALRIIYNQREAFRNLPLVQSTRSVPYFFTFHYYLLPEKAAWLSSDGFFITHYYSLLSP